MKNKILIFLISFFIIGNLFSQSNFEMGITTGTELNFASSSNYQNIKNYRAIPGFNIGLRLRHNFGIFSLIGGIEYGRMYFIKQQEQSLDPMYMQTPETITLIANQIRLPILFQINIGQKKSQFFANIGPCFLITMQDAGINDYGYGYGYGYTGPGYPSGIVQTYNMGGMLGAGYSYQLKHWFKLFSEVRFTVPIVSNPAYTTDFNTTRKLNLSLQFGVSFLMQPAINNGPQRIL